jgi:hypothetical protein
MQSQSLDDFLVLCCVVLCWGWKMMSGKCVLCQWTDQREVAQESCSAVDENPKQIRGACCFVFFRMEEIIAEENVRASPLPKQLSSRGISSIQSVDDSLGSAPHSVEQLITLEEWIRQRGGENDVKCRRCGAPFLRGEEASICVACGNVPPPKPNPTKFNYKLSIAFLRFLETIHRPIEVCILFQTLFLRFFFPREDQVNDHSQITGRFTFFWIENRAKFARLIDGSLIASFLLQ